MYQSNNVLLVIGAIVVSVAVIVGAFVYALFTWFEAIDTAIDANATAYTDCVSVVYHQHPSTFYGANGYYPECEITMGHD